MQKKYPYRQRQNYTGYSYKNRQNDKKAGFFEKLLNALIFCVVVVILLFVLKFFNVPFAASVIDKAKYVFTNSDSYLAITKEKVNGFVNETIAAVFGEDKAASSTDTLSLIMPCEGDIITKFGQENKTYNVKNCLGILIKAKADGDVCCAMDCEVKSILPSVYGGVRIICVKDTVTIVYDGVSTSLVAEGKTLKAGQLIGQMTSSKNKDNILCFELYVDNQGQDPTKYLKKATTENKTTPTKTTTNGTTTK